MGLKKGWGEKGSELMWERDEGFVISKITKGMNGKDIFIVSIYNTKLGDDR